jgi:hypothetical protein
VLAGGQYQFSVLAGFAAIPATRDFKSGQSWIVTEIELRRLVQLRRGAL